MKKSNLIVIVLLLVSSVAFSQNQEQTLEQKRAQAQTAFTKAQTDLQTANSDLALAQTNFNSVLTLAQANLNPVETKDPKKIDANAARKKAEAQEAAQAALDTAKKNQEAAQTAFESAQEAMDALAAKPIKLLGTWLCNGSSKEKLTRETPKQKAASEKKKKNEEDIEVTLDKICNDEPTGLPLSMIKGIASDKKFDVKNAGTPLETKEMNPKYFPATWSCSKPTNKVVNTFFIRLQERDDVDVNDCQLTPERITDQEWDKNNLPNTGTWTVQVGETGATTVKPNDTDSVKVATPVEEENIDPDAVWRQCTYTCEFNDWSVLDYDLKK
jgi:hypothetical protein